jgi:hypothetical protein
MLSKIYFCFEMLDVKRSRKIKLVARCANGNTLKFAAIITISIEIAK